MYYTKKVRAVYCRLAYRLRTLLHNLRLGVMLAIVESLLPMNPAGAWRQLAKVLLPRQERLTASFLFTWSNAAWRS